MTMYISGLGMLGIFGKGRDELIKAVKDSRTTESYEKLNVDLKAAKNKKLSSKMRRADRFTKMAVYSVGDAVENHETEEFNLRETGVILTTAFGPHNTTFGFLDELITYGEKNVSPIKFSHSVHNAAASYIAQIFNIKGPVTTVAQYKFPVVHAITLARSWLENKLCENVLVCSVEEKGNVFDAAVNQKLKISDNNRLKPINFSEAGKAVPAEGAVSFLLTSAKIKSSCCRISQCGFNSCDFLSTDCYIAGADGIPPDQTFYKKITSNPKPVCVFSPVYGSIMTGTAFDIGIAVLILNNYCGYNDYIVNQAASSCLQPKKITCVKSDCCNDFAAVSLETL
ncbi:MAG: beta-ketoacyl synthase chain length factor [Victivallales bacterium]|nr:beta-ketoacyl synthase chain length factor [Victivallales bacterium]